MFQRGVLEVIINEFNLIQKGKSAPLPDLNGINQYVTVGLLLTNRKPDHLQKQIVLKAGGLKIDRELWTWVLAIADDIYGFRLCSSASWCIIFIPITSVARISARPIKKYYKNVTNKSKKYW